MSVSLAAAPFVQQAADRLVSRGAARWDSESNKTVLFRARDGIGVVSYAGAAHMGDRYTDAVIASAIAGRPLDDDEYSVTARLGGKPWRLPDVGLAMLRIVNELRREATACATPRDLWPTVVAVGWKWHPVRAFWVGIREFLFLATPRQSGRYEITDRRRAGSRLVIWPIGYVAPKEIAALGRDVVAAGPEPSATGEVMARAIRQTGDRCRSQGRDVIGEDVMTITIPHPAAARQIDVEFTGSPSAHGGYWPWVVGSRLIVAPSSVTEGMGLQLDGFSLRPFGPFIEGVGMASHRRRPIPRQGP